MSFLIPATQTYKLSNKCTWNTSLAEHGSDFLSKLDHQFPIADLGFLLMQLSSHKEFTHLVVMFKTNSRSITSVTLYEMHKMPMNTATTIKQDIDKSADLSQLSPAFSLPKAAKVFCLFFFAGWPGMQTMETILKIFDITFTGKTGVEYATKR